MSLLAKKIFYTPVFHLWSQRMREKISRHFQLDDCVGFLCQNIFDPNEDKNARGETIWTSE